MRARLAVRLRTAALPGGGEGRAATLDRDVVADEYGLPRLPAKRLKGLLLEAAWEIERTLRREYAWNSDQVARWVDLDGVFGGPGAGVAEVGLRLDDLELPERAALSRWLRWASRRPGASFSREAVLRVFTEERSQTRIDDETGAAQDETLRRSRLLRRSRRVDAPAVAGGSSPHGRWERSFVGMAKLPHIRAVGSLAAALEHPHVRTLGLACAGLKRLGLGRNRGVGWVSAQLEIEDEHGDWIDVTAKVIEALAGALAPAEPSAVTAVTTHPDAAGLDASGSTAEAPGGETPGAAPEASPATSPSSPASAEAAPPVDAVATGAVAPADPVATAGYDRATAHVLPLYFELDRPALLALAAGSPSLQHTLPYVPGAVLLGALGRRWIEVHQLAAPLADDGFRRLFVSGHVRFLDAHLEQPSEPGRRLLPLPRSMRQVKGSDTRLLDLAAAPLKDDEDEQLTPLAGEAGVYGSDEPVVRVTSAARRIAYHTARARNRAIGRATDRATDPDGALFVYEAIESGQTFVGAALGTPEDLRQLVALLAADPTPLVVGRSGTAEYGGGLRFRQDLRPAPFESEAEIVAPLAPPASTDVGTPPAPGDQPADGPAIGDDGRDAWGEGSDDWGDADLGVSEADEPGPRTARLVVTLTSPLLAADASGAPTLVFPVEELAEILCAPDVGWLAPTGTLEVVGRFQGSEVVGGYSGVWRLPRPTWEAIAAGSVFTIDAHGLTPRAATRAAVEWRSLGLRTAEGFGRFAVDLHGTTPTQRDLVRAPLRRQDSASRPEGDVPAMLRTVAEEVTRAARLDEVRRLAAAHASRFAPSRGSSGEQESRPESRESGAVPGLLVHLAQIAADRNGFKEALDVLDDLSEPARRALDRHRAGLVDGEPPTSLLEWVRTVLALSFTDDGTLVTAPLLPAGVEEIGPQRVACGLDPLPDTAAQLRERQVYLLRLAGELPAEDESMSPTQIRPTRSVADRWQGPVIARTVAVAHLELQGPAHFGGGEGDGTDATVLVDGDGCYLIPGSTLAGALRSHLRRLLLPSRPSEEDRATIEDRLGLLFGTDVAPAPEADRARQSALAIEDAYALTVPLVELRDGVAIDPTRRVARPMAKYDYEALTTGATFATRLILEIRADSDGGEEDQDRQELVRELFALALRELRDGRVRCGALVGRGFGRIQATSFAVADVGLVDWLRDADPVDISPAWRTRLDRDMLARDPRVRPIGRPATLTVGFALAGPLLIRSVPLRAGAPDVVQLRTRRTVNGQVTPVDGEPVAPGSSWRGVLRAAASRVARTHARRLRPADVERADEDARALIVDLFGPDHADVSAGRIDTLKAGRIVVEETILTGTRPYDQTRNRIDRVTGAVLDGALFTERPEYPFAPACHLDLTVEVREWSDVDIGLLLQAVKDLWLGDVALGGGASVGRGTLQGHRGELTGVADTPLVWRRPVGAPREARGAVEFVGCRADDFERFQRALTEALGPEPAPPTTEVVR